MANTGKFTRGKEKAIAALLSSTSVPDAAKTAGVAERTLYRWLGNEIFQERYRAARKEVVKHAVTTVQTSMTTAVKVLRDVMVDRDAPASARVSAARAVLDLGLKAVEIEELTQRVDAIEKQIGGNR